MYLKIDNNEYVDYRLDQFLSEILEYSRNYISKLIKDEYILINNNLCTKPSTKLKLNDEIFIKEIEVKSLDVVPKDIKLDIVYDDEELLIVNKERGMVVHPSNGHYDDTLVNAIMYHYKDKLSNINGVMRPGIVHRIDKDTSGLLCICKTNFAHNEIAKQFKEHTNIRKYICICKGVIKNDKGIIESPIGRDKHNRLKFAIDTINGKYAKTEYKVLKRFNNYTFVECTLYTGRTHQIRVHMKSIGHTLLGDLFYGSKDNNFKNIDGQILHAKYLEFTKPSNNERLKFDSLIPKYFMDILERIEKNNL